MSGSNPYADLPPGAFWRSGVAEGPWDAPEGLYRRKFAIAEGEWIATAGSCFAQHIGRRLRSAGYAVLDVEPPPPWLPRELQIRHAYGIYSARYGNLYTVAQLAQLAQACVGRFDAPDLMWERDGRWYDPFRPAVEPDGYDSAEDVRLARRHHLARVRTMFRQMDVFVFTLGLTECWVHNASGAVLGTAPGVLAGAYDPDAYAFKNLKYGELLAAFREFLDALAEIREGREVKVLLTVSPVPLTATAGGGHVLPATTYSKSVLRAVAGDLAGMHPFVDYFPSYEIVTNPAARGAFFDHNLRTVREAGVETVMRVFFAAHPPLQAAQAPQAPSSTKEEEEALLCEEAILAAFGP